MHRNRRKRMAQLLASPATAARRERSFSWGKLLRQVVFYAALLLLWEGLSRSGIWQSYQFAGSLDVATTLKGGFLDGTFPIAILVSLRRLAIGYGTSLVIGVLLGLLIGRSKLASETLGSLVLGLQALPSVCWIPLA